MQIVDDLAHLYEEASMKVPPKRKGNLCDPNIQPANDGAASMKVPPKRKGNPGQSC